MDDVLDILRAWFPSDYVRDPNIILPVAGGLMVGLVFLTYIHFFPGEPTSDFSLETPEQWYENMAKAERERRAKREAAGKKAATAEAGGGGAKKKSKGQAGKTGKKAGKKAGKQAGKKAGGAAETGLRRRRGGGKGGGGEGGEGGGEEGGSEGGSGSAGESEADGAADSETAATEAKREELEASKERIAQLKKRLAGLERKGVDTKKLRRLLEDSQKMAEEGGICMQYAAIIIKSLDWLIIIGLFVALLYFMNRDYGLDILGNLGHVFPKEAAVLKSLFMGDKFHSTPFVPGSTPVAETTAARAQAL
jgi:hypothetical protein